MPRDKNIKIELENENPAGTGCFYAGLELPATYMEIRDAVQRARGVGGWEKYHDIRIRYCRELPELEDTRLQAPTVRELNCFAARLNGLSETERTILRAVFRQRRESGAFDDGVTMKDLINLTYDLDCVPIASNVSSDEQLGQLVIECEMNRDVNSVPKNARYLLDKARIGQYTREQEAGVYLDGLYIPTCLYHMPEAYDGVHLPEEFTGKPEVFRLQIAKGPRDDADITIYDANTPEKKAVWISLPISRAKADSLARELGARRIEDCVYYGYESAIPQITRCVFGGMENFTLLNAIAERFEAMWESTQIKYKAVLQAERIYSLEKALDAATHIQEYELSYYSMDSADFMRTYMAHHLPEGFDMGWLDSQLLCGNELIHWLGACMTEYGIVSGRGKPLFELVPFNEPQKEESEAPRPTEENAPEIHEQTVL